MAELKIEKSKTFKGTPGPWVAQRNSAFWEVSNIGKGNMFRTNILLYSTGVAELHHTDENEANATAIAAVPELLEAVQMMDVYIMEQMEGFPPTVSFLELRNAVRKSIEKAEL